MSIIRTARSCLKRAPERQERGAAAVEFALTVVPLLMIVFAVIHFGFAVAQKSSLNSSVRSGARYGSVNLYASVTDPHTCAKVISRSQEGISTLGMASTAVTFKVYKGATLAAATTAGAVCTNTAPNATLPCQGAAQSDNLYVVANYTTSLIGIPLTGVSKTINFQSVGAYRCEYS